MKSGLRHFVVGAGVVGLLAASAVASTPTFTVMLAGIKKPGQDEVIFRNLPSTQFGLECDPNNDPCPIIAGPGSACVLTEVFVSGLYQHRCSPIRGIVPLLCVGGPIPGQPCEDDADCAPGTCTASFVEPGDQIMLEAFLSGWDDDPWTGICTDHVTECSMTGTPPCPNRWCFPSGASCTFWVCPPDELCIRDTCEAGPLLGACWWTPEPDSFASQTAGNPNASMYPALYWCSTDDDCPHRPPCPWACWGPTCEPDGTCSLDATAYIDITRADSLCKDTINCSADVSPVGLTYTIVSSRGLEDDQKEEYVGTLWLQVPYQGAGTYNLDLINDPSYTNVIDQLGQDFPSVNIEGLQVEVYDPCDGFDVAAECGEATNICRVWTCVSLRGSATCIEVERDCEAEVGPGYDCDIDAGGCVPFRACCLGNDHTICRVRSTLRCGDQGGLWVDGSLTCGPPNPCMNCEGALDWASSIPPSGVLDARQPRDVADGVILQGIDCVVVTGDSGLNPACFTLCETESEGSSNYLTVVEAPPETYTITLDRRITPGAVTKITFNEGENSESAGTYSSLPVDTNADGVSNTDDVIELIECCLNKSCVPTHGEYSCDVDHSGSSTGADVLRLLDLLNGAGDFMRAWDGIQLTTAGCP